MRVERKNDGDGIRLSLGVWLACVAQAIVMIIISQFAYTTAITIWRVVNLIILISCSVLWKITKGRRVARSFTVTSGILSVIILLLSLIPTGVTEWG